MILPRRSSSIFSLPSVIVVEKVYVGTVNTPVVRNQHLRGACVGAHSPALNTVGGATVHTIEFFKNPYHPEICIKNYYIYNTHYQMDTEGVLILRGPKHLNNCKPIIRLLKSPPEFKNSNGPLTLGGFGALAIPSSFHHPDIRFIRKVVYDHVKSEIRKYFNHSNLELLFDRVSVRRRGTSTSPESWHRDVCPNALPNDIILGGWINLDPDGSPTQKFSCSPGTHRDARTDRTGFVKTKENPKNKKIYEVPPGHVILFHQNILHEVKAQKATFETHRLYLGWRLTESYKPLFDHSEIIKTQGVPNIPSGQIPPMYAKLHLVNHRYMIKEISQRIKPEYLDSKTGMILRELPPLGRYYPEYTEDEKKIMTPQPF